MALIRVELNPPCFLPVFRSVPVEYSRFRPRFVWLRQFLSTRMLILYNYLHPRAIFIFAHISDRESGSVPFTRNCPSICFTTSTLTLILFTVTLMVDGLVFGDAMNENPDFGSTTLLAGGLNLLNFAGLQSGLGVPPPVYALTKFEKMMLNETRINCSAH